MKGIHRGMEENFQEKLYMNWIMNKNLKYIEILIKKVYKYLIKIVKI